jgi:hypothetical protein
MSVNLSREQVNIVYIVNTFCLMIKAAQKGIEIGDQEPTTEIYPVVVQIDVDKRTLVVSLTDHWLTVLNKGRAGETEHYRFMWSRDGIVFTELKKESNAGEG